MSAPTPITYDPPQPNAALVVGPDDVLVLSFPGSVSRHEYDSILAGLLPELDGRVQIVVGGEITVIKPAAVIR